MVSATEAFQMGHIGFGHLDVVSMTEVRRVGGGVSTSMNSTAGDSRPTMGMQPPESDAILNTGSELISN